MAELSVPVEELLTTAGPIAWPEALALVQGLIGARAGEPGRARLEADGHIVAEPGPLPTVTALARLLQTLLPPPGTPSTPRVPAALRYSLIRATGGVTAPPFVSVEDFSHTLQRFEQGDRQQLLRALFARRKSTANAHASAPARALAAQAAPTTPATWPLAAASRQSSNPAKAGSRVPTTPIPSAVAPRSSAVAPTASAIGPTASAVEWDSWPLEGSASRKGPEAATGRREKTPPAPRATRRAGPLLSTLVALSLLVAGAVVGAAVFVHADGRPPSAIFDALAPQVTRVKQWVAGLRASFDRQDETDRSAGRTPAGEPPTTRPDTSASAADRQGDGEEPQGATPAAPRAEQDGGGSNTDQPAASPRFGAAAPARSSEPGARGTAEPETQGTSGAGGGTPSAGGTPLPEVASPPGTAAATAPAPDPVSDTSLPGELVVALDGGRKPVFSPSFASDGTAVFFDEDSGAAGSALKEARTGGDKLLHVLSVLDDGARNYHPQLSPNGTTVAFDSDRDGVRGVYLSNRAGGDIRRVSGVGYAAVPSWSPDGRRLAFIKAEPDDARVWNLWTLDVASGTMRQLTNHRVGQPWGASWFPDGRRICYSHEDRLIVFDTQSGASRVYPSPRRGILVRTPAVSPDGRRVIFQLYRHGAWMLDLDDGAMRQVLDDPSAEEFAWSPDGSRVAFHSRRDRQWGIRLLSPNPTPSR